MVWDSQCELTAGLCWAKKFARTVVYGYGTEAIGQRVNNKLGGQTPSNTFLRELHS